MTTPRPLDFDHVIGTDRWERAKPTAPDTTITSKPGTAEYWVRLPGGEKHRVALALVGNEVDGWGRWGACDCRGFHHGWVCSHLSAIRKLEFIGEASLERLSGFRHGHPTDRTDQYRNERRLFGQRGS